jgi:hypothetical protein
LGRPPAASPGRRCRKTASRPGPPRHLVCLQGKSARRQ